MVRTQISLTEAQMAALRDLADQRRVAIAAVVRDAVDVALATETQRDRLQKALAAVSTLGTGSGGGTVARDHDHHLVDAFEA